MSGAHEEPLPLHPGDDSIEVVGSKIMSRCRLLVHMRITHRAILLALMMATMSLAGCVSGEEDELPAESELPDDWQVHYATSASDLPECVIDRFGWLYYISSDQNFRVCTQLGWEPIDISGPAGPAGVPGANGMDGQHGLNGTNGADGMDGQDGPSVLINAVNSTGCLNGGHTYEIGSDEDGDGLLSITEVQITMDICNGAEGPAGADGQDGAQGSPGMDGTDGQDGAQGPPGMNGTDGQDGAQGPPGLNGTDGQDGAQGPPGMNGSDGHDGTDGAQGPPGMNGTDGLNALISMTHESSGQNCANGGTRIDAGVDDDGDGILDASEVDQSQYVCDGGSSNNTMLTTVSAPPSNLGCDAGGRIISQGIDNGHGGGSAANGVLEPGEIVMRTTFCSSSRPLTTM